jgi:hypothetical protein
MAGLVDRLARAPDHVAEQQETQNGDANQGQAFQPRPEPGYHRAIPGRVHPCCGPRYLGMHGDGFGRTAPTRRLRQLVESSRKAVNASLARRPPHAVERAPGRQSLIGII